MMTNFKNSCIITIEEILNTLDTVRNYLMFEHVPVELTEMNAVTTESGRKYRTPEGIDLPSITTVLSILSRDSIAKWRKRVGAEEANRISYRASTRGTSVHAIIEKYIKDKF